MTIPASSTAQGATKTGREGHSACGAFWNGLSTAHCSACHATFATVKGFDLHRRGGRCRPPADAGLVLSSREYECWGFPG